VQYICLTDSKRQPPFLSIRQEPLRSSANNFPYLMNRLAGIHAWSRDRPLLAALGNAAGGGKEFYETS